jgi:exodeoxyribonuclease VII small subunit
LKDVPKVLDENELTIDQFEHYMTSLEALMNNIEKRENYTLEQYLIDFENGADLIAKCEHILNKATIQVNKITKKLQTNKYND